MGSLTRSLGIRKQILENRAIRNPIRGLRNCVDVPGSHIPARGGQGFAVAFPLWGLMFVLFGLAMLLSPLWAAWTAGSVYYVVTERRAIIFEKRLKLNIQSFSRSSVAGYERVSSGGAGGSIIFQRIVDGRGRVHG